MKYIKLTLFLLIIIFLSACKNEKNGIRFAFQNRIGSTIPIIAVEKNFFKKYGLEVEPMRFNSGPSCAEALYSGSADIGTMGDTTSIIAISRSENLIIAGSHSTGEGRHRLIVLKDSAFSSIEDLKGGKIGIKKGTSTYGGFLAKINSLGLTANDFQITDLSPSIMPDALFSKSIDAFAASEPTPSLAETRGGKELADFAGLNNSYPIMIVVKKETLKKRRKDLLLFFRALKDAEEFIKNNEKETLEILQRITNLSEKALKRAFKRHEYKIRLDKEIMDSLGNTAIFLKSFKKINELPDFNKKTDKNLI